MLQMMSPSYGVCRMMWMVGPENSEKYLKLRPYLLVPSLAVTSELGNPIMPSINVFLLVVVVQQSSCSSLRIVPETLKQQLQWVFHLFVLPKSLLIPVSQNGHLEVLTNITSVLLARFIKPNPKKACHFLPDRMNLLH
jgi:hypothetical protein